MLQAETKVCNSITVLLTLRSSVIPLQNDISLCQALLKPQKGKKGSGITWPNSYIASEESAILVQTIPEVDSVFSDYSITLPPSSDTVLVLPRSQKVL
jgi:hypothetical protein